MNININRTTGALLATDVIDNDTAIINYLSQMKKSGKKRSMGEVYTPNEIIAQMTDCEVEGQTILEPCCGLAPFLFNRYNLISKTINPLNDRMGIADRLIRSLPTTIPSEWLQGVLQIIKRLYAFEYDTYVTFLARINAINDIRDYYVERFPDYMNLWDDNLPEIEYIISWNIFQNDIFTHCIPGTESPTLIMDWEAGTCIELKSLKKG
jgi:hypothetical protein